MGNALPFTDDGIDATLKGDHNIAEKVLDLIKRGSKSIAAVGAAHPNESTHWTMV